jgi:hypothetical protein
LIVASQPETGADVPCHNLPTRQAAAGRLARTRNLVAWVASLAFISAWAKLEPAAWSASPPARRQELCILNPASL